MYYNRARWVVLSVLATYSSYVSSACTVQLTAFDAPPKLVVNVPLGYAWPKMIEKLTVHTGVFGSNVVAFETRDGKTALSTAATAEMMTGLTPGVVKWSPDTNAVVDVTPQVTISGGTYTLSLARHVARAENGSSSSLKYETISTPSPTAGKKTTFPSGHPVCSLPVNDFGALSGLLKVRETQTSNAAFSATLTYTDGTTKELRWNDTDDKGRRFFDWEEVAPYGGSIASLIINRSISLDVRPKSINYGNVPANEYHSREFSVTTDGRDLDVPIPSAELSFKTSGFPANVQVDVLRNGAVVNNVSVPLTSDNVFQVRIKSDTAIGYASGVINVNAALL